MLCLLFVVANWVIDSNTKNVQPRFTKNGPLAAARRADNL